MYILSMFATYNIQGGGKKYKAALSEGEIGDTEYNASEHAEGKNGASGQQFDMNLNAGLLASHEFNVLAPFTFFEPISDELQVAIINSTMKRLDRKSVV